MLGGLKQQGFALSPWWRPEAAMQVSQGCTPSMCPISASVIVTIVTWLLLSLIRMLVFDVGPILLQDELIS